jgi:hypothetical protein
VTPLSGREWTLVVGLGLLPLLIGQGAKALRRSIRSGSGLDFGEVVDNEE